MADAGQVECFVVSNCGEQRAIAQFRCLRLTGTDIHRCVKMFPSKTRADVGMVQCVSEGHGKPPGGKTIGTRRAGPCKEGDQPVPAKPMQIINTH